MNELTLLIKSTFFFQTKQNNRKKSQPITENCLTLFNALFSVDLKSKYPSVTITFECNANKPIQSTANDKISELVWQIKMLNGNAVNWINDFWCMCATFLPLASLPNWLELFQFAIYGKIISKTQHNAAK